MKMLQKSFIKFFLIPLLLLGGWVLCALFLNPYESFSSITYPNFQLQKYSSSALIKGTTVRGDFTATEDNLGTVLLKFINVPIIPYENQDILVFRIKEKNSSGWYSQNLYHSGIFRYVTTFPFGFPSFHNAKRKEYIFELESTAGNLNNAVSLDSTFNVRYGFDKITFFKRPYFLISFILKKMFISLSDIDYILDSFIYLTPFLLYIIWFLITTEKSKRYFIPILQDIYNLSYVKSFIHTFLFNRMWIFSGIFLTIFLYSYFTKNANLGISVFIIGWWILAIYFKIVDSKKSFIFFAILLSLGFLGIIFSQINFSTRISSWAYIFLALGMLQAVLEERAKS